MNTLQQIKTPISTIIGIFSILLIYILAGFKKIFSFQDNVTSLKTRNIFRQLPYIFSSFGIFGTILIEIVAPLIILFSLFYFSSITKSLVNISITSIIVFTLLASFLYHPPTNPNERINFLKNIGLIGGLILMYDITK